jgi:hypothetical protein
MWPRQVLDPLSVVGSRAFRSYLHTGTLPRLIPVVCHSYEKCRGVRVFFPNWNASALTPKSRGSYAAGEMPALSRRSAGHRNSHGIISFADPHSLNSLESYRYKNVGGGGGPNPQGNGGSPSKNKKARDRSPVLFETRLQPGTAAG